MTAPRAFVAGWPITHSRSPMIHRFWLERYGLDGEYMREAVPPDQAAAFFRTFREQGFVGGNVTLPHKAVACQMCDRLTALAEQLQVVNTLWVEDGLVFGDNTDPAGFTANMDDQVPSWRQRQVALVIGAGGAARGIISALLNSGFSVSVANRTKAKAVNLVAHFNDEVSVCGFDQINDRLQNTGLIVNATSSGVNGTEPIRVNWERALPGTIAADLVYFPLVTPFLSGAATAGLRTVDGLGMLLHQAAPGFERWFGVRPTVDAALREHVLADLRR